MEEKRICTERGTLLTFSEIFLLLQSMGTERVNGICMEQEEITDEDTVRLIAEMVRKGFLIPDTDRFRIEEETGRMMTCMAYPEDSFELCLGEQIFYCYGREGKILVTSLCQTRGKTLELAYFEKKDFEKWREGMENGDGEY